ncbi:MAG: hypothetical protein HQ541_04005 [Mariniphaga sp.]|nr:hypothetical protein [Mariniphaga sp.]
MEELKKDQVAPIQANSWIENLASEKTFSLEIPEIILQKKTYEILANKNLNRIRIKLGLENVDGKYQICAFAISAVSDGCNYLDNVTPVYKLAPVNEDYSNKIQEVNTAVDLWKSWRLGEIGEGEEAPVRQYIYPISYLVTKCELNEIFNIEGKEEAQIGFGIIKTFTTMIYSGLKDEKMDNGGGGVYDFTVPCPPICPK